MIEKRRYKVSGFREIPHSDNVRVILDTADAIRFKSKDDSVIDMMKNPSKFAEKLMGKQMEKMIHDSFLISQKEYQNKTYDIGDYVIVTIEKE